MATSQSTAFPIRKQQSSLAKFSLFSRFAFQKVQKVPNFQDFWIDSLTFAMMAPLVSYIGHKNSGDRHI